MVLSDDGGHRWEYWRQTGGAIIPITLKPRLVKEPEGWKCYGLRIRGRWFKTQEPCWALGETPYEAYDLWKWLTK